MAFDAEIISQQKDGLKRYTHLKQEIAARVRGAKQLLEGRGDGARADECQTLLVKLAEDRFNLAVVGQFKRGKSSLMNALIGRDLLPTGLLPLTSAITTLCYGPRLRVILERAGWALTQEIALDELAEYVTEQGNPGNQKGLVEARVELPVPFLRRGLYFMDTPGVGSARQENTATTYSFLPNADAVIFVTSVEAPLSETEHALLRDLRGLVRKLFVVVNKIDLLAPPERAPMLTYIRDGVHQVLGADAAGIHPLSARQGLSAKQNGDDADLKESGLPEFENVLAAFLARDKEQTFLIAALDHLERILDHRDAEEEQLRQQLAPLRAAILQGKAVGGEVGAPQPDTTGVLEQAIAAQRADTLKREEKHARSGTCPVCDAQVHAVLEFFAAWQHTLATDEQAQRAFAAVRGFCHFHTWQFEQIASPQGLSIGYAELIDTSRNTLRAALEKSPASLDAQLAVPSAETCAACRVLHEAEERAVQRVLAQVATVEGRARYNETTGVCLPHLQDALPRATAETAEFLMRAQIERLEEISEDMRSYAIKREALRRALLNKSEETAWRRALVQLVGERNVRME